METILTVESRNRRGNLQRSQRRLSGSELTVGRSTRAQIHLPDPRVALEHARITVGPDGATLVAEGAVVRINGWATSGGRLSVGDVIEVGPFRLRVEPPPAGCPLALTLQVDESAAAVADNPLDRILLPSRSVSKRRLSYFGLAAVVLLFLVLPVTWDALNAFGVPKGVGQAPGPWLEYVRIVSDRSLQTWDPGPLSRSHQTFRADCRACHQVQDRNALVSQLPFVTQVMDRACLACHKDLSEHAPRASLMSTDRGRAFAETRCASCHRDHKDQAMAPRIDALCALCHRDIRRVAKDGRSENVTDFAADHPRFRVSLLDADTDQVRRVRFGNVLEEKSNLKFSHKLHLDRAGVRAPVPTGRKKLVCDDCHEPADDGRLMAPVSMERHCSECHSLKFDCSREKRGDPLECRAGARQVPHGPVADVAATLHEFYARLALGDEPPDVRAPPELPRIRPGAVLTYEDRQPVLALADRQARRALDALFGELNVCGTCHHVRRLEQAPGWSVAPVRLAQVWMPAARFTHLKHGTLQCVSCHAVQNSSDARGVSMPDLAKCRECHVGGKPVLGKVTSDCVDCHKFHGGEDVWNHLLQAQARDRRGTR